MRSSLMLLIFCSSFPLLCFGWGLHGHRVIGRIAELHLAPAAKAEIRKLLVNESIAMASNWADLIKSDRTYDYLGPWHYVNLPPGLNRKGFDSFLAQDTATNLYNRINFLIRELKSRNASRENKIFYLKLLIHLVGDVHQPMHTGRRPDRGGNGIRVYWFNEATNLHRVWDEHLIEFQQLSYTEYADAINFASNAEISTLQRQKPADWFFESYQLAERLYADIKPNDKLGYPFNYKYSTPMNQQLLRGGIRLAGLLNEVFRVK
jgi:hypothetical protein